MYRRPPRRRVKGPRFDGARELDRWLREGNLTVPVFCETHGIDRHHVDRLLRGTVKRCPSADIVDDIQRATFGRIIPAMWRQDTLREDVAGEVPVSPESSDSLNDPDASDEYPTAEDSVPDLPDSGTARAAGE